MNSLQLLIQHSSLAPLLLAIPLQLLTLCCGECCKVLCAYQCTFISVQITLLLGYGERAEAGLKNLNRWGEYIQSLPLVKKVVNEMSKEVNFSVKNAPAPGSNETNKPAARKEEGKFIDLPDARDGEVVVRFPPEASG